MKRPDPKPEAEFLRDLVMRHMHALCEEAVTEAARIAPGRSGPAAAILAMEAASTTLAWSLASSLACNGIKVDLRVFLSKVTHSFGEGAKDGAREFRAATKNGGASS